MEGMRFLVTEKPGPWSLHGPIVDSAPAQELTEQFSAWAGQQLRR